MLKRFGTLVALAALLVGSLGSASVVSGAGTDTLTAKLAGSHEVAPVDSAGTGTARVVIAADGSSVYYQVFYSGLSGPLVAAHIHLGAIGANAPVALPFAVGPSPLEGTLTAANFTGANGLTFAQALEAIRTGGAYVNLHTAAHKGGEIRGQLYDASVTQNYLISADAPEAVPAGHLWAYNDFFPRTLTVATGSIVRFAIKGFHTGTILPAGVTAEQDLAAGGSVVINDPDDTVRNPNGTTHAQFNIPALLPELPSATCGTADNPCSFDGTHVVQEGAPLGPPTPPTAIRIDATNGTYVIHCRVHPAMVAWLNVVSPGDPNIASPDDVSGASAVQVATETAAATATYNTANHNGRVLNNDGTTTWIVRVGAETPDHHVNLLEMIPAKITIHSGDRVLWRSSGRQEPHTITFPKDIGTDTVPVCEAAGGADGPCAGPPDELEFGGGNGVTTITSPTDVSDSGLVMPSVAVRGYGVPSSASLPSWRVSFAGAVAGTYTYVCQIHDGMAGTIVVGS